MRAKMTTPTMYAVSDSTPRIVSTVGSDVSVGLAELGGCVVALVDVVALKPALELTLELEIIALELAIGVGDGSG